MSTSTEQQLKNPLYEPEFKQRSHTITNKKHIPLLQTKSNFKFVFLGDSHIERLQTTASGIYYRDGEKIQHDVDDLWQPFYEAKTLNLGIGGDSIQHVLHRLFKQNLINYLPATPDGILIWVGTNDIENYDDEIVYDGIINLVNRIQKSYSDIKHNANITVMSMLPKFSRTDKINTGDLNKSIQRLNYRLAQGANKHKYHFLDVFYYFYHDNKIITDYFLDNCHLNYDGYTIVTRKLRQHFLGESLNNETNKPTHYSKHNQYHKSPHAYDTPKKYKSYNKQPSDNHHKNHSYDKQQHEQQQQHEQHEQQHKQQTKQYHKNYKQYNQKT